MSTESNLVFETRMRHRLTQKAFADRLGVAKNYIYLLEAGRKPLTKSISQKLAELDTHPPCYLDTPNTSAPHCRYPEACDLQAEFGHVRKELASLTAQLDTVTRLLGSALGKSLEHDADPHVKRRAG